jgi:hypothetical protein
MSKPAIFSGFFIGFEESIDGKSMDDFGSPKSEKKVRFLI